MEHSGRRVGVQWVTTNEDVPKTVGLDAFFASRIRAMAATRKSTRCGRRSRTVSDAWTRE